MSDAASLPEAPFGAAPDGRPARLFSLETPHLAVRITDYGGRIVSIAAPDRNGRKEDVVLGFDDVSRYAAAGGAFGALLGRNANRIAGGEFTLDGRSYRLPTNDRSSTLHGGPVGFDKVLWDVASSGAAPEPWLALAYVSPDGDQGFPGELAARATYRLDGSALELRFEARTSKPTIVSLSAHPYFNLAGAARGDVLGHVLTIVSDAFLPTDEQQIPTGEIRPVAGTVLDFRSPHALGARIRQADRQLIYANGYDHAYVLAREPVARPRLAAHVLEPSSGRTLEILTTQPALQLYSGNKLDGSVAGRGVVFRQSAGVALEPQGFPDAPHHPAFPSTVLRPGEEYRATIRYRFGMERGPASRR